MSAEPAPTRQAPRRPWVVALVAFASLVIGFAVAQSTGVRWLGAVVLVLGGLFCLLAILPVEGAVPSIVLAVVYIAAFAVSHPLGHVIGTWPSVLLVATITAVVAYALIRPTGSRVSTTAPPSTSTR